jgi:hypothetical protein
MGTPRKLSTIIYDSYLIFVGVATPCAYNTQYTLILWNSLAFCPPTQVILVIYQPTSKYFILYNLYKISLFLSLKVQLCVSISRI